MKIKQKIICFISVIMVCIPIIFMFPVTASAGSGGYTVQSKETYFPDNWYLCSDYGGPNSREALSCYQSNGFSYPYAIRWYQFEEIDYFGVFDFSDPVQCFNAFILKCFSNQTFSGYNRLAVSLDLPIYYCMWIGGLKNDLNNPVAYFLLSNSEMTVNSSGAFVSDTPIDFLRTTENQIDIVIRHKNLNSSSDDGYGGVLAISDSVLTFSGRSTLNQSNYTYTQFYSNCPNLNLPDNYDYSEIKGSSLSDQVEVTLTPEFGLDMDRVFDRNTGQNDYFKFEVTNNSDKPIQFSASIVPVGTELYNRVSREEIEEYMTNSGNVGESLSDFFCGLNGFLNESALWNYLTDCEYYILQSKIEFKKLYFSKDVDFYVEERKGNFYWIFVPPNSTYSDYIYWENVKITPKTKYDIVFTGLELDSTFQHSSAVFADDKTLMTLANSKDYDDTSNGFKQIFESNHGKPWTIFQDVEYDSSVNQYKVDYGKMEELYRQEFSVNSIPSYTNIIKGGNAKITSGWSDTQKQIDNPYYIKDLQTGNIQAISNWSEFNGSYGDVNVDISNITLEDVKGYISYSQDFFKLVKSVLLIFPPWIWVLICFGLTALIVIGIVKALL